MNEEYRQFRNRRVLPGAAKRKDLRLFFFVEERLDIAKRKNVVDSSVLIANGIRNRNTVEFFSI